MEKPRMLDGRAIRDERAPELAARAARLVWPPVLAIVQVGDRPDSASYVRAKVAFAARIGAETKHIRLSEAALEPDIVAAVERENADPAVRGIIVQLPLPIAIDQDAVIESIDPAKDCDGLTALNVKRALEGRQDAVLPATTRGVKELLARSGIDLFGKHVTVVGRSMLVGKPLAAFALNENATVTICHSKTADLALETRAADVLIVAAGKPKLIGAAHVKPGAVVIDVGLSAGPDGALSGDVDFDAVASIASAITPVPGGVGPMTVLGLFENLLDLCERG